MPLVIPERTIDALFTFELLSAAPTAIVVSPNNNRGARTPDHEVQHATRQFVFECKTLYSAQNTTNPWHVRVPLQQLSDYVTHGLENLVYVLPAEPPTRSSPWVRTCRNDPDPLNGWCLACTNPPRTEGALHFRRWAGNHHHVATASEEKRLQPWFNHWAWCIRADGLEHHLKANPSLASSGTAAVPAQDTYLEGIPGAVRLCHFMSAIMNDHDRIHDLERPNDDGSDPHTGEAPFEAFEALLSMSMDSIPELTAQDEERRMVVGY